MSGGKSGIEAMFRAMGMGEVLDAANQLAASGAVPKIIAFADDVGTLRAQLARVEAKLDCIAALSGTRSPDGGPWGEYDWNAGLGQLGRFASTGELASGRGDVGGGGRGVVIEGELNGAKP